MARLDEADVLRLWRSWTGYQIYEAHGAIENAGASATFTGLNVEQHPDRYTVDLRERCFGRGPGMRLGAFVLVVGALVIVAGCAKPGAELIDDSGAVSSWVYHPAPVADLATSAEEFAAMEEAGAVRVAAPAGWDLRVVWGASSCQTAPTIRVSGTSTAVTAIEVEYGPKPPGDCPDSLELHAVDLRMDPPSAAAGAVVSGHRGG